MNSKNENPVRQQSISSEPYCQLCGSTALQNESPGYWACLDCGTLAQFPLPDAVQFEESMRYEHEIQPYESRWLSLVEELRPAARSLLDLGAANGGFIEAATQRGWQTLGLEGSPGMVSSAKAVGRDVILQDLDQWEYDGPKFGVVRLWFVLEHVRRPGHVLTQALKALLPRGLLLLSVPNDANWLSRRVMRDTADRFWEHSLHMHHFPPFGLESWLQKQGFELVIGESGRPTELMRDGNLPLFETWERIRALDPGLSRLFYQLGVGRSREMIFRYSSPNLILQTEETSGGALD
jgi:SAM-dependent methyltransferase